MARQNPKATIRGALENRGDATTNLEGGLAFQMEPKLELYTRVATALVGEPKFYDPESEGDDEIKRLIGVVAKQDPQFVLDLAVYARHSLYLRTIPIVLLVEACKYPETRAFVRQAVPKIVTRSDQLTEVVAYWKKVFGDIGNAAKKGMLSNPLKRGLADAFDRFNAYSLAKYDRDGEVKLRDVLRIVHPKPKSPEQAALWKQVLERTLTPPDTWEVVISGKGSTKENWESVIPKMGYMALLRNLRNFLDKDVYLGDVLARICTPAEVKKSKQFPYRFFSAYREIEQHNSDNKTVILDALEGAMRLSVQNVPRLAGTTFISADNSGSMGAPVSEKSKVSRADVANVLQALASSICDDAITSVFGQTFATVTTMKTGSLLQAVETYKRTDVGHSTNAFLAIDYLTNKGISVDRIIIFSDMQCYDSGNRASLGSLPFEYGGSLAASFRKYCSKIGKTPYLYSVDLAGYGTSQFPPGGKVCLLAGWSDRVFEFFHAFESTGNPDVVFGAIRQAGQFKSSKDVGPGAGPERGTDLTE